MALTVGGAQALFLVDTGASVHTFARWFVDASELRPETTDRTTIGSTGHESRVELVSNIASTLENGRRFVISQAIVADFPALFAQHRIGGLLSPHLLAGSGEETILDLRKPQLTFHNARPRAGARVGSGDEDADGVCTNRESPFRNRLYSTTVRLDGVPAKLLIDTGATHTMLSTASPAAERFANRTVAGGESQGGRACRKGYADSVGGRNARRRDGHARSTGRVGYQPLWSRRTAWAGRAQALRGNSRRVANWIDLRPRIARLSMPFERVSRSPEGGAVKWHLSGSRPYQAFDRSTRRQSVNSQRALRT